MLDSEPVHTPEEIITRAVQQHKITKLYCGFFGGKDSAVVTHFVASHFPDLFGGCIFCDTGIKVAESKKFVIEYCHQMNWKLFIVHPKRTYAEIVMGSGFPGPSVHNIVMRYLKYIPMRDLIYKFYETGQIPAITSGVRRLESDRRFVNATSEVYKDSKMIFVSPMLYKTDSWMYEYYIENGLKRSPVYDTLHISGDCLCGCFSKPGEAKMLEIFHPAAARQISDLEKKLREKRGPNGSTLFSTWGKQAGMIHAQEQDSMEKYVCTECIDTQPDNSDEFLKELEAIETKLNE